MAERMELPIICTLTPSQLLQRRIAILDTLGKSMVGVVRLPNGCAYEFPATTSMLAELRSLVELERECCRFLDFKIVETSTTIHLNVTGPTEALGIITELFGVKPEPH